MNYSKMRGRTQGKRERGKKGGIREKNERDKGKIRERAQQTKIG